MNEKDESEEIGESTDKKFLDWDDFSQFYEVNKNALHIILKTFLDLSFYFLTLKKQQFSTSIKDSVASATKIPLKQNDLDYYSTSASFKNFMQSQNERILKM